MVDENKMKMASAHILNSHPEMLYLVTDQDGNILRSNPAFKEFVSHIKPKSFRDIVTIDEDFDGVYGAIQEAKKAKPSPITFSCQTKGKTGRLQFIKWSAYSILNSLHFTGLKYFEDVSHNSALLQSKSELLDGIMHSLHHDVRQPMRSITGLLQMRTALVESGAEELEIKETDELIVKSIADLDHSISEVLLKAEKKF